jgi:hypothetical protein
MISATTTRRITIGHELPQMIHDIVWLLENTSKKAVVDGKLRGAKCEGRYWIERILKHFAVSAPEKIIRREQMWSANYAPDWA